MGVSSNEKGTAPIRRPMAIMSLNYWSIAREHRYVVPDQGSLQNYVYLAAGWNILIEAGLKLGVNLDKAERARKVGNEFVAS